MTSRTCACIFSVGVSVHVLVYIRKKYTGLSVRNATRRTGATMSSEWMDTRSFLQTYVSAGYCQMLRQHKGIQTYSSVLHVHASSASA